MKYSFTFAFLALFGVLPSCLGQILYQDPSVNWEVRASPVRRGNGISLSPDEGLVISSSNKGVLTALDSSSGDEVWTYEFPDDGVVLSCYSGVEIVHTDAVSYIIYSIIIDEIGTFPTR